jgi:hypothetical protein
MPEAYTLTAGVGVGSKTEHHQHKRGRTGESDINRIN